MSKTMFYALLVNCLLSMTVYAEKANGQVSLKEIPLSMQSDNVELSEVFNFLNEKTGFSFSYNDSQVDLKSKVSVHMENGSLLDVLTLLSQQKALNFKRIDNNIHVQRAKKKSEVGVFVMELIPVSGRVTDSEGNGLPGATVVVKGTTNGTTTDVDGNFNLEAEEGETLVISYLGFESVEVTVGNQQNFNIVLNEVVNNLQEVVVTATGVRRKVEIGNSIARLEVDEDVKIRPISNVSDLLQGQAAGVQIFGSGGSVGMGSRIRVRGSNSASLSNEPVIYIDGVLINNQPNSISFETGGQSPSRFNDINPEDIESIEIIKGPSAATLYGSIAANGVIRITTKKGKKGKPRWTAYTERGFVEDVGNYPANFQAYDANGNPGFNFEAAEGAFVPTRVDQFQPLNDDSTSPFRTGQLFGVGTSVSGGNESLTYYLSGNLTDNEGVLPVNNLRRLNLRANFGAKLSDDLKVNFSSGYTNSNLELPLNDNYALGLMGQGLNGSSTPEVNEGWGEFTPAELFTIETRQKVNRYTTGLNFEWTRVKNLTVRLSGGLDYTNRWDLNYFPTGRAPSFLDYDQGARFSNRFNEFVYTLDAVANYKNSLSSSIDLRSSVGFQYLHNLTEGTMSTGLQLVAGSSSIAGAAQTFSNEETIEQITTGVFIEEQFSFNDKLFITGALRSDRGSAFGASLSSVVYPKVSASWVASDETLLSGVSSSFMSSLRFRGAWGASGVQPGTNDALRFFNPIAATVDEGQDVTGVTFGSVGNVDLQPERSREIEIGFDGVFASNKISLEVTYFNKQTSDALIFRQLPLSLGAGNGRFENLGSVKNTGVEISLDARIIDVDKTNFSLGIIGAFLDNELIDLGDGIEPVIFGQQRQVEGYPLGGYWDEPYTFSDVNGDGFISESEVQVGTEAAYLGSPFATTDISLMPKLSLFDGMFEVGALLNYRGGQKLYNNTGSWRNGNNNTDELNDPNASLEGQARAVAAKFLGTFAGYIEDASFTRLREVSVTYNFPGSIAERINASRLSLTLSGQNLGVWTDYTGLDPEISSEGQSNFTTEEFLSQPPVRMWKARLNITF